MIGRDSKRFLTKLGEIKSDELMNFPDWFRCLRKKAVAFLNVLDGSFGNALNPETEVWGVGEIDSWKATFLRFGSYLHLFNYSLSRVMLTRLMMTLFRLLNALICHNHNAFG